MTLKEEIEGFYHYNYTQAETVDLLLKKGYSEAEVKAEIFKVYDKITRNDIVKSFPFISTIIIIGLISLAPLVGYFFEFEWYYGAFSVLLLLLAYGYYELNGVCIIFWSSVFGLLVLFLLVILFIKLSGMHVNSTYSFGVTISLILFSSMTFRNILDVHSKNNKFRSQYEFN